MQLIKPFNQAVTTRETDPKPRLVRLRSLAARAVCGFLAIAALLTLPVQAQAQTTIWSSTLTVKDTLNAVGCSNLYNSCADYLSNDGFTYDGSTYRFVWIVS